jgi:hypothetical protein
MWGFLHWSARRQSKLGLLNGGHQMIAALNDTLWLLMQVKMQYNR